MIYLDYVATTPLNEEVNQTYQKLLNTYFANSDSAYKLGYEVDRLLEKSRNLIANMMQVESQEIIFTSCGSESNNMAIKGICFQYQNRGKHIITTSIEHSSVLNVYKQLEEVFGFDVDYLSVDENGKINLEELKQLIREDTILISMMHINNEIGSINPIREVRKIINEMNPKIKFHVDYVQTLGKYPIDLSIVDTASFSAHKINGLKGSGFLYKNKHTQLIPLIVAGQQEFGLRGGTENALTHIVLAKTLRLALDKQKNNYTYVQSLMHYLRDKLEKIDEVMINSPKDACDFLINFSIPYYKSEVIVHQLEEKEIYISTKSACSSLNQYSHTLESMHLDFERVVSALRVSISYQTTYEEIDTFIDALKEAIHLLRRSH